jgi:catechol 2,3-dioxygenase-like lactoylglutathione lyase family enzyme
MSAVLRHVLLLQRDVPAAARFYQEGLGLTVTVCTERWAELSDGRGGGKVGTFSRHFANQGTARQAPRARETATTAVKLPSKAAATRTAATATMLTQHGTQGHRSTPLSLKFHPGKPTIKTRTPVCVTNLTPGSDNPTQR